MWRNLSTVISTALSQIWKHCLALILTSWLLMWWRYSSPGRLWGTDILGKVFLFKIAFFHQCSLKMNINFLNQYVKFRWNLVFDFAIRDSESLASPRGWCAENVSSERRLIMKHFWKGPIVTAVTDIMCFGHLGELLNQWLPEVVQSLHHTGIVESRRV